MKTLSILLGAGLLLLSILACGSSAPVATPALRTAPLAATESPPTASTSSTSRCVPASAAQMQAIRAGVKGIQSSNEVRSGWAVRSNDYERVWIIAAMVYGPGMEKGAGPGIWAMGGPQDDPAGIMSVDGTAKEFSDYPDAAKTKAGITMDSDGAQEAHDCAVARRSQ